MKTTKLHIGSALVLFVICPCWQPLVLGLETSLLSQEDPNHAILEVYSLTYHLGTFKPGSQPVAVFAFRNVGNHELKITNLKKCCGAVAPAMLGQ